jgi:hypothetical protein
MTTTTLARTLVIATALTLLGCPKPIDPPQEIEPASTTSTPEPEPIPGPCTYDDDCPRAEICDGGECLQEPTPTSATATCGLSAIHFARGSARLSPNNQVRLADALGCLRELTILELTACTDPNEDPELAPRRAASVVGLLTNSGVPADRLRVAACPTSSGRHVELRAST